MKINLKHNGKPIIEPKSLVGFCSEPSILHFQLETNEDNINIIKDIKQNFVNIQNSNSFFFIETIKNVYFFSGNSFYSRLKSSFEFAVILMNEDKSLNQEFNDYYLFFNVSDS